MKSALQNKFKTAAVLAALLLPIITAFALEAPRLTGRVVDNAGMISTAGQSRIESAIRQIEKGTGGQMAVLTIGSLQGEPLEEYSMKVAEAWKLGKKGKDNGLLLLIAKKERKIRFEVGYGWEGKLNDAKAGDIIRGMQPYFRSGKVDDGVLYAVAQVYKAVAGKALANVPAPMPPPRRTQASDDGDYGGLVFLIFVFIFIALVFTKARFYGGYGGRYYSSGGSSWSSGGSSWGGGGGFSGGGGSFGGGGASGGW